METGKWIRFYREQAGYSQKDLGEILHLGERTIGHYETKTRIPPIDKLQLIAQALEAFPPSLILSTEIPILKKNKNELIYQFVFSITFFTSSIFD